MSSRRPIPTCLTLLTWALLAVTTAGGQTTWHVDDDAPNDPGPGDPTISDPLEDGSAEHPFDAIQEGINAATAGDTVLVADGTYTGEGNKQIDFGGKAITVRSESGTEHCVIDCQGERRAFRFHSGETAAAVLDGVTITNGRAQSAGGAGILCTDASNPTIVNCVITQNEAEGEGSGAGIRCHESSPTISNCVIRHNSCENAGGGIYAAYGSAIVTDCVIAWNSAGGSEGLGGGIFCEGGDATISGCLIADNTASSAGGGIYCDWDNTTITDCVIERNTAEHDGGGVCGGTLVANCLIHENEAGRFGGGMSVYTTLITGCTIRDNLSDGAGGGIHARSGGDAVITNCVMSGNVALGEPGGEAGYGGGGVNCYNNNFVMLNSVIRANSAVGPGGGVRCRNASPAIANCILWDNDPEQIVVVNGEPAVTYCDVQGGWPGEGNIDVDPQFALPQDDHLMPGSPCIDTGTNEPPGGLPPEDLEGNPRVLDGDGDGDAVVDMGPYEFNPGVPAIACSQRTLAFFVQADGTPPDDQLLLVRNCGTGVLYWEIVGECSWLEVAPSAGESSGEIDEVTLHVDASDLPQGMHVCEVAITDPNAANSPVGVLVSLYVPGELHVPEQYPTIQDAIDAALMPGDVVVVADGTYTGPRNKNLDFGGRPIVVRSENGPARCIIDCEGDGRGFIFQNGETADSVVDGLTIRNGYVAGDGGGICCLDSSPTISNCTISGNTSSSEGDSGFGGGICCFYGNPMITNCTITGNTSDASGGGVCANYSSPTIANCVISENTVSYGKGSGGGVACREYSTAVIVNCTISHNTVRGPYGPGGGINYNGDGDPTIINCVITGNRSGGDVGGICCYCRGNATITNCTIAGNTASYSAGGIHSSFDTTAITNCIVWGNVPDQVSGNGTVRYCDVQGGWEGEGNIAADPAFAFPDDYHLANDSPCIDAGTNDPAGGLPADDLDGNPRPLDGDGDSTAVADMGAYEFNPDVPSIAVSPPVLEFFVLEDDPNTHNENLSVRNCGGGTLNWEVEVACAWLQADPPAGQSNGEIDEVVLSADVSELSYGRYECEVTVSDPAAMNSPRAVHVVLYVSTIRHVPDEYETIQAAIDASLHGDAILLADGTYTGPGNKDLDFGGRRITVRSENGPENCIIDCEGQGRGFHFHSGESPDAVVEGLTIRNGYVSGYGVGGGGIYCYDYSSPTILNCVIADNTGEEAGGVYCYYHSDPTIANCTISGNVAADGNGGGVHSRFSNPTITNCTIVGNEAFRGGGLYLKSSSAAVNNCIISGNVTGEAYYAHGGGGIYCYDYGRPTITNCAITANTGINGGGICCCYHADATVTNCTIVGNSADAQGGGLRCYANCGVNAVNSILWANSAPDGAEIALTADEDSAPTLTVAYCDVEGGADAAYVEDGCTLIWNPGNIEADPGFAFPDDVHLMPDSACIDAGTNEPTGGLPADDLDGNPRPLDGDGDAIAVADMGAYEFSPDAPCIAVSPIVLEFFVFEDDPNTYSQILSIRNSGTGTLNWAIEVSSEWLQAEPPNGQSNGEIDDIVLSVDVEELAYGDYGWTLIVSDPTAINSPRSVPILLHVNRILRVPSAYETIQAAIDASNATGDIVLVADGVYTGVGNKDLDFGGKRITVRSENGPDDCIIDCEADGRGFYFHSGESSDSVVEGLTISNGDVSGRGGGIYCDASNPLITGCVITGNAATNGGGVGCYFSNPTFTNCTISANTASDEGGGIYCYYYGRPTIQDCTISGNVAARGGGVYCEYHGNPEVTDCVISGNTASTAGGGVRCDFYGNPKIANCTISGNTASTAGGIYCDDSSPTIINCAVTDNTAFRGAGVLCNGGSSPTIVNSVISGNVASSGDAGGISCPSHGSPTIANCTISGNTAGADGGGVHCSAGRGRPAFINCTIATNTGGARGGGVYCCMSNPTITNCTIWGNTAPSGGGLLYYAGCAASVANSVLWGNSATNGAEIALVSFPYVEQYPTLTVAFCEVAGGQDAVYVDEGATLIWGEGNIDADPLFADPNDADYHLSAGSPCIDAGCNCAVPPDLTDLDGDGDVDEFVPFDLDGEGRFFDDPNAPDTGSGLPPIVDMGAYEFGGSDSPPCLGDLDGDRDVDFDDLVVLLGHYGMTSGASGADGDMDCDGDVQLSDLADLLGVYGESCE